MERIIEKRLSYTKLKVEIRSIGEDYHILLQGGERPHIGCTVLAVPRQSLVGEGQTSSTASVLNVTGHKDEQLCRYLAEKIAVKYRAAVVCTGGFHVDGITKEQIAEAVEMVQQIADEMEEKG